MQSSEHDAQIDFVLRATLILLRYGNGDLESRNCPVSGARHLRWALRVPGNE
jgi:hypothetical protein